MSKFVRVQYFRLRRLSTSMPRPRQYFERNKKRVYIRHARRFLPLLEACMCYGSFVSFCAKSNYC